MSTIVPSGAAGELKETTLSCRVRITPVNAETLPAAGRPSRTLHRYVLSADKVVYQALVPPVLFRGPVDTLRTFTGVLASDSSLPSLEPPPSARARPNGHHGDHGNTTCAAASTCVGVFPASSAHPSLVPCRLQKVIYSLAYI